MIERQEIERIAHLAKLQLSESEILQYTTQLGAILDYVAQLNELDTTGVVPATHALPHYNVFRPDERRQLLSREQVLQNAPEQENGYFKIPQILA